MFDALTRYLSFFRSAKPSDVESTILTRVTDACRYVPFYRELLKTAGLSSNDFVCLQDVIDKFPKISTSQYRDAQQNYGHEWMIDERFDINHLKQDRSSGSSGVPVSIYRSKSEVNFNNAKTLYHLTKGGLRPWHRVMAVVPPMQVVKRDSNLQRFGIFRRYTVDYQMSADDILEKIESKKINAVYGQKSFLLVLADRYGELGKVPPTLKFLMPGAERIDEASRRAFQRVFRPESYGEFYGATETGIIASCHHQDYEVNYHGSFFCLTDPVSDGELTRGGICVTSLFLQAQPVIMLNLGDVVTVRNYDKLLDLKASIVSIDGRDNDYLVCDDGSRIAGATFYTLLQTFSFMRQFRIIQERPAHCRILIRLIEDNDENRRLVEEKLKGLLSERIAFDVEYVDVIDMDNGGKTKILVSNVNVPSRSVCET